MGGAGRVGESVSPPPTPRLSRLSCTYYGGNFHTHGGFSVSATETVSNLIFSGPLVWTDNAECRGQNELFFAPAGERPETRSVRESKARAVCTACAVMPACREWARENREYGFWGGESEEERAAAGYRVDMPVGRVACVPQGQRHPGAPPRPPRCLNTADLHQPCQRVDQTHSESPRTGVNACRMSTSIDAGSRSRSHARRVRRSPPGWGDRHGS